MSMIVLCAGRSVPALSSKHCGAVAYVPLAVMDRDTALLGGWSAGTDHGTRTRTS